ncbi:lipoyl(octanoyl) transferase LipB [Paludibacter jiangxiensis]|uniref:Octanoyltransferase n=1 Tax=Paludibacter jiangxiensis TaxID=681398 RepID=A0A171AKM1_9BACT|nr:lipoyl(octanoyl) transferase LipB [Paludibacter jiangxiensis]GAT63889.1 lipoyl(octanoyl) transferase [Paludibacter jiangxiensis]
MNNTITPLDWNIIEYNKAWQKQEALFQQTIQQKLQNATTSNYLILCEHPHVFTLGKNGSANNLLIGNLQLRSVHAQYVETNRGGDITYHGPGQIVGYPIFDLTNFDMGLKQYIFNMEEAVISTLKRIGIQSERLEGATGVWLDTAYPDKCRKICAIGVRSSHFVTMHGFALNVNTDLNYFSYINPCGFVDKGVTSIQKELGSPYSLEEIKQLLREEFNQSFLGENVEI